MTDGLEGFNRTKKEPRVPYNTRVVKFKHKVPLCCPDVEDYKEWKKHARVAAPHPKHGFCEDCTPEYQAKMKKQNLCENPEIIFGYDKDGILYGHFPPITKREKNEAR